MSSTGLYSTADVILPPGTVNPMPVTVTATNTPVGTIFTIRLIPQFSGPIAINTTPSNGTFASSTASASLTIPTGQMSVLNAFASFTLPQIAGLFPLIDGEPVDRIMVATTYGGPSSVTLITRSGKEGQIVSLAPNFFVTN